MAISCTQAMRPAPYTIPPPRIHPMHRPTYASHYAPHFSAPNTTPSTFFQSHMLSNLGSMPMTSGSITSQVNSHVMSPPTSDSATLNHGTQRSHSSSSGSPIQTNSPGLGSEPLSADQLKPCPYSPLQNALNGVSSPTSCSQPAPLIIPTTHHQAMLQGPMYSPHDYGNMNIPTATGPACLSSLPVWNPYPTLPTCPMNPLPSCSLPKLTYDTPRYKLTPERAIPLIKWFEDHKDHPYPTRHEKILLCQSTQLTFTQVSTWFANARRRMKKANSDEEKSSCSDDSSSQNEPESPSVTFNGTDRDEDPSNGTHRSY